MVLNIPILIACILNLLDVLVGLTVAIKNRNLKSSKLRDGLFKKIGFLVCYFLAWGADNYGYMIGFSISAKVLPLVLFYVCTTEMISIIENISRLNPAILPETLMKFFNVHPHTDGEDKRNA